MLDKIKEALKEPYWDGFVRGMYFTCLVFFCVILFCQRYNRKSADSTDIDGTVSTVKHDIGTTKSQVTDAQREVQEAQVKLSGAISSVRESRERAESMSRETDECQQLVDECLRYNQQAREILESAGSTDRPVEIKTKTNTNAKK